MKKRYPFMSSVTVMCALATRVLGAEPPPLPAMDPAPVVLAEMAYDEVFFPGAAYDAGVPTPDSVLGFRLGNHAVTHAQIESVIKAIAAASPRVRLVEYGRTHEGRTLYYVVVGTPERVKDLDALRRMNAKLNDPRTAPAAEVDELVKTAPATAWMAYCIHGDEMSGSDAALAVLHHLAAGTGDDVRRLLDNLVVIIDPLMNPDGRDRCISDIQRHRDRQPQVDDQSLSHTGVWPSGRMNHYLFDMNRDWIFCTQPETRGRVAAARDWAPHYFMESHEMGSQDTFLFMPPRDPVNPNYSPRVMAWVNRFALDMAGAFDARGWRYYTGEWNEEWYPGYSSSWAALRGAVENLYEQASIATDGVRRPEGAVESYRESVHKQVVASMANLGSLAEHRAKVLADFVADRREVMSEGGTYAGRTFAIVPGPNRSRLDRFLDLMRVQGFEYSRAAEAFKADATDRLGRRESAREFPVGTILVPNRQPLARLLAAMLEFDPRMTSEFLTVERRELLRFDRSKLYDITGWSLPMLFDVECWTLTGSVPGGAESAGAARDTPGIETPGSSVGFVIDGGDDRAVAAAARLMESAVRVRCADKPISFDGRAFARGSIAVTRKDNPRSLIADLGAAVEGVCRQQGITAFGIRTGLGPGDMPDLGGEHFVLLQQPRVAVLAREPVGAYSYGQAWYTLDHVLGLRASYVDFLYIGSAADLRRYNVIIVPDGPGEQLTEKLPALKPWVESGGTLIAIGSSAAALAKENALGQTRLLDDVLTKPDAYIQSVIREWEGRTQTADADTVYSHTPPVGAAGESPGAVTYPWDGAASSTSVAGGGEKVEDDELKRRDAWRKIFMPQGVVLAARADDRHWLTSGLGEYVPVMFAGSTVLACPPGVSAPLRLGVFNPAPKAALATPEPAGNEADDKGESKPSKPRVGWAIAPPGHELRLRMSGLLWPEAAERLANAAYVTREGIGKGQVILFASDPNFRAATLGTSRVFANAVVLGPGMGASRPITP